MKQIPILFLTWAFVVLGAVAYCCVAAGYPVLAIPFVVLFLYVMALYA